MKLEIKLAEKRVFFTLLSLSLSRWVPVGASLTLWSRGKWKLLAILHRSKKIQQQKGWEEK